MPELPEVETIRRVLAPRLSGKTVCAVKIFNAQVIAAPAPDVFCDRVRGQTVGGCLRRGKFLRLMFLSGDSLTLHLRMTGCLTLEPAASPPRRHTHLAFVMDDGTELRYEDPRRFGRFWFAERGETDQSGAEALGPEPFAVTARYLCEKIARSKRPVKAMLLDQTVVAGIGNIYSDEILFSVGIRPDRPCCGLTDGETSALAAAIAERMQYFIEKNAITFEDYTAGMGREYRNTPFLQVYGKAGMPCPVCGGTLSGTTVGGRSSVFCPHCQT